MNSRVVIFTSLVVLASQSFAVPSIETIEVYADLHTVSETAASYSVDALTADEINESDAHHPSELLRQANVWISQGSGQEHLTAIRSPVFTGAGACGNFLISEDGIPVRAQGFCNVNQLFDTFYETSGQIDVYRGPLSAARGSNALFGGIDFYTPKDDVQYVSMSAANHDTYQLNWNTQFGSLQSYGSIVDRDSFREGSGVSQQKLGFKTTTTYGEWQIENNLQLNNLEQETAGFIEGFEAYKNEASAQENPNSEAYRDVQSIRAYSRWQRVEEDSAVEITPYTRYHDMEFLMHFVPWQPVETNRHHSLGAQLRYEQKHSDSLSSLQGVDVEYSQASLQEIQYQDAPFGTDRFPRGVHYDYHVNAAYVGAFSHWNWQFATQWLATAQVRFDHMQYDYDNQTDDGFACEQGVVGCRFYRPSDQANRFDNITGRLALRYEWQANHYVYTSVGNAYRAPQATELYRLQAENQNALKAPSLRGVEIGLKGQFKTLGYKFAAYDQQLNNGIYQNSERLYLTGAETRHKGVEYALDWQVNQQLALRVSGQFANHRYANNPDLLGSSSLIKGNQIDTAPRQQHTAQLRWSMDEKRTISAQYHRLAGYYLEPANAHRYGGHDLLNVRFSQQVAKNLVVSAQLKNALDKAYAHRADIAFGEYRYFPADGRNAVLSIRYTF